MQTLTYSRQQINYQLECLTFLIVVSKRLLEQVHKLLVIKEITVDIFHYQVQLWSFLELLKNTIECLRWKFIVSLLVELITSVEKLFNDGEICDFLLSYFDA